MKTQSTPLQRRPDHGGKRHIGRRQFVAGTSAIALSAALSGCLDEEIVRQGTDTEGTNGTFDMTSFVYTTERARAYGEYTQVDSRRYTAGENIWMYLEFDNVTPVDDGPHLETAWAFIDPYENVIMETTDSVRVDSLSDGSNDRGAYVTQGIHTDAINLPSAGEYTIRAEITDVGSEKTVELSEPVRITDVLEVDDVVFIEQKPTEAGEYQKRDETVYSRGETVWVYIEPRGTGVEQTAAGEWKTELSVNAIPTGPDGEEDRGFRETMEVAVTEPGDTDRLFVAADIEIDRPVLGEYTLSVECRDHITGDSTSRTESFQMGGPELEGIAEFRELILEDNDIEIERLELRGDEDEQTLSLHYTSSYVYSTGEIEEEVGFISGAFAVVLSEEFAPDSFRAVGTDADDAEFSFSIESDIARQFMADEISSEEYAEHVTRRLRQRD